MESTTTPSAENLSASVTETLDPSATSEFRGLRSGAVRQAQTTSSDDSFRTQTTARRTTRPCSEARPMQKGRFVVGLLLTSLGVTTMLIVALGAFRGLGVSGSLSLPVVALCMIIGLMLLGGGFGIMATAAPRFDDSEFERLMQSGTSATHAATHDDHSTAGTTEPAGIVKQDNDDTTVDQTIHSDETRAAEPMTVVD